MKKNFVKKLALGLAMVMAVSSVNVPASAATNPFFKTPSVTVEEGKTVKAVIKKTKGWTVKKVVSKDTTVATIKKVAQKVKKTNVKVTGVKAGATVVKAVLKKNGVKVKAKLAVTVKAAPVVGTTITLAKAKAINAIDVTVVSDTTEFAKDKIVVYNEKTKVREAVRNVKVSEDGKNLVITLYNDMVDGYTYSVSVNGSDKYEFGVTIGEIASIVVEDATVLPIYAEDGSINAASDIVYHVYDENGLEITSKYPITSMNIETTAYTLDGQIYLYHKGDAATVKLTYNYYDKAAGKIIPIVSNEATYLAAYDYITAMSSWYISGRLGTSADELKWVAVGDTGRKLVVTLVDNKGNEFYATDFQSTDPTILFVQQDGTLEARKAGTVQVIAQYGDYKTYVTVEVKAARVFTALTTATPSVTLSNHIVIDDNSTPGASDDTVAGETTTINFVAVDQYGCPMATETANIITEYSKNATDTLTNISVGTASVSATAMQDTVGTAYFKATCKGQTAFANVAVVTPGNHVSYKVSGVKAGEEFDTYYTADYGFTFAVYSVDANGVKRQIITNNNHNTTAVYNVVNSKNEYMVTSGSGITLTGVIATSGSAISTVADLGLKVDTDLASSNTINIANSQTSLENGAYSLVVTINRAKVVVPFTVASTRTVPAVNALVKNVNVTTADNFADVLANTVLTTNGTVEGVVITSYIPGTIDHATGVITSNPNKTVPVLVKKVVVQDEDGFFHIVTVGEVAYEGIVINAKVTN